MWTNTHIHLKSRVTLHHSSSERKVLTFNIFLLHQGMFRDKKIFFLLFFRFFLEFSGTVSSASLHCTPSEPTGPFLESGRYFQMSKVCVVCVMWNSWCLGRREARNEVCTSCFFLPPPPPSPSPTLSSGLSHGVGCTTHLLSHGSQKRD